MAEMSSDYVAFDLGFRTMLDNNVFIVWPMWNCRYTAVTPVHSILRVTLLKF